MWGKIVRFQLAITLVLLPSFLADQIVNTTETIVFNNIYAEYSLKFDVSHILLKAKRNSSSVQMSFYADSPMKYSFVKCGNTMFSTWNPVQLQKLFFQDDWIDWMLNISDLTCEGEGEDLHQIHLKLIPTRVSSGKITFKIAGRQNGTYETSALVPNIVNKEANETAVYNAFMAPIFSNVMSCENREIHLVTELTAPVKMRFGKCGFVLPGIIFPQTNDNAIITDAWLKEWNFLSNFRCAEDNKSNVFQIFVTTVERTTGDFVFKVVLKKPEMGHYFVTTFLFLLSSVLVYCLYDRFNLMKIIYTTFFARKGEADISRYDNSTMGSVFYGNNDLDVEPLYNTPELTHSHYIL